MINWKDIKGYEGLYQISNTGEVKSLARKRKNGSGSYVQKEKILKKTLSTTGYYKVELTKEGERKSFKVHRLVALNFLTNRNNKRCVNHIDGNKLNNDLSNLNWVSHKENSLHSVAMGLSNRKLTHEQEKELIQMYLSNIGSNEICEKFNISKTLIMATIERNRIAKYNMSERRTRYNICEEELREKLKVKTQKEIALEYGCDASLISHYKKRIENGGIYKC